MLLYGKCECFVIHMLYVCVLCASCDISQCCVLHDLQFVNAGRGCKRRPYGREACVCVLRCCEYVSFGNKLRPRTFGCVAMGSAVFFILRSKLLIYSSRSEVNRV